MIGLITKLDGNEMVMNILKFLFRIFYSPLKSYGDKGRSVAIYWLSMPLVFLSVAVFNTLIGLLGNPISPLVSNPIFFPVLGLLFLYFWLKLYEGRFLNKPTHSERLFGVFISSIFILLFLFFCGTALVLSFYLL
jgi:hypothetical protein